MEEIFGEIEDEFDTEQLVEKTIDSKTFVFSARLEIDYLNERYNLRLPESEEYTTLGGFLIHHQESIPHKGQKILIDGISFEVMQASNTKIDLVKLSLL
jgi:CBS domain containing-hemolysin-like protein